MNITKHRLLKAEESGLVSFFVVMIVMIVLSLVVVAFSRLINREQRQTLDRELNSQAFYAAEAGVNDALTVIAGEYEDPTSPLYTNDYTTDCGAFTTEFGLSNTLSPDGPVEYTCLLVDPSPSKLEYADITKNSSIVVPLRAATPIQRIHFHWRNPSSDTITGCEADTDNLEELPASLPPNCAHGILRVEIVPFDSSGTRDSLLDQRAVFFIQPRRDAPVRYSSYTDADGPDEQGLIIGSSCVDVNDGALDGCSRLIRNLNFRTGYLRITPLYEDANIFIEPRDGSDNPVGVTGAQVEIDATGKATDVLKRVVINVPLVQSDPPAPVPGFALFANKTICKRFNVGFNSITPDPPAPLYSTACNPLRQE